MLSSVPHWPTPPLKSFVASAFAAVLSTVLDSSRFPLNWKKIENIWIALYFRVASFSKNLAKKYLSIHSKK